MKKFLSILAVFVMISSPMAVPVLVHAEQSADDPVSTTSTDDSKKTESDADKTARSTRVEKYRAALAEKLTEAAKTRIAARCVAAQAIVKAHITRSTKVITNHSTVYDNLLTRLDNARQAIGSEGVNNLELEENISVLKEKVDAFKAAAEDYSQALSDLSAMDCKTDPEAFKAALEAARKDQLATLNAAKDIRTYLTDTVKPTLKALKEAVDANNSTAE